LRDSTTPDTHKLKRFLVHAGRIHIGHKELTSSSIAYQKVGLALIKQGISDTLCSMDSDLIPRDILDQVGVFFQHLNRQIFDDIGFWDLKTDAVSDLAVTTSCPMKTR
jgi:phage gp16-like protein